MSNFVENAAGQEEMSEQGAADSCPLSDSIDITADLLEGMPEVSSADRGGGSPQELPEQPEGGLCCPEASRQCMTSLLGLCHGWWSQCYACAGERHSCTMCKPARLTHLS